MAGMATFLSFWWMLSSIDGLASSASHTSCPGKTTYNFD
jgi:hypothetical protein